MTVNIDQSYFHLFTPFPYGYTVVIPTYDHGMEETKKRKDHAICPRILLCLYNPYSKTYLVTTAVTGVEPMPSASKAAVLPLYDTAIILCLWGNRTFA